jgi:hypothetical protein
MKDLDRLRMERMRDPPWHALQGVATPCRSAMRDGSSMPRPIITVVFVASTSLFAAAVVAGPRMATQPLAPHVIDRGFESPPAAPGCTWTDGRTVLSWQFRARAEKRIDVVRTSIMSGRSNILLKITDALSMPRFSPRGDLLVYPASGATSSTAARIAVVSLSRAKTEYIPVAGDQISVSPDSRRIAFYLDGLCTMDLDSTKVTKLAAAPDKMAFPYALWAPDGGKLVAPYGKASAFGRPLAVYHIDGRLIRRFPEVRRVDNRASVELSWCADSRRIVVCLQRGHDRVRLCALVSSRAERSPSRTVRWTACRAARRTGAGLPSFATSRFATRVVGCAS